MNMLLLSADSLRADRTSLFGHSRDTTPFLSTLSDRSFEFRRAYANGRNTSASFPSIHTSTHQRYYDGIGIPEAGTPTMAEVMREDGYGTFAIHTNELVSRDYNFDRGFEVYRDSRSAGDGDRTGGWRAMARDAIGDGLMFELVKRAHFLSTEHLGVKIFDTADSVSGFEDRIVDWTTKTDGDWFVWAHYMNPHHPYEPPVDCQTALGLDPIPRREATKLSRMMRLSPEAVTADERDALRGLYDASVLSWDREVESTYRALGSSGELADTLVIVTADHGELLGEDGVYGHPNVLNQPLLRIPLLFSGGPVDPGESDAQVGLLDLAPTILTLAGSDVPDAYLGRPLFAGDGSPADLPPEPLIAESGHEVYDDVCVVDRDRKVVYDLGGDSWQCFELFDDALGERETDGPFEDLRGIVRAHLDRVEANRQRGADVDEDALREDLAALGYLDE